MHTYIYMDTHTYAHIHIYGHTPTHTYAHIHIYGAFLVAQMVKNPSAMQETLDSIPGSGRSPGEGMGCPLHYSCLENSIDR